jgi:hypothetical protein
VAVICGLGDLVGINNYTVTPIKLEVYSASPDTECLVDSIEQRWGLMESQVTSADLDEVPVLATRELTADPHYVPDYRPAPGAVTLDLELSDEEHRLLAGLIATGVYGSTESEAVRAAFMRWCNSHVTRIRRPFVDFTGKAP